MPFVSRFHRLTQLVLLLLMVTSPLVVQGQASTPTTSCGKAKVSIPNAIFLTASSVVIAVELPSGWTRYEKKSNPFFFLRVGDHYETARTLMYVNVQRLDGSLDQAAENDVRDFRRSDPSAKILDEPQPEILEKGCAVKSQRFIYADGQKTYVDQVTKIAVNGLLLNVVLTSDSETEVKRYQDDYDFLLKHVGLVMSAQ
jgi:hypothetical protein